MLNNKSVLITGGTGSFGKHFTGYVLKKYPKIRRLVIFSRDELKQFEMSQFFNQKKYPNIRFFLGMLEIKQDLKQLLIILMLLYMPQLLSKYPLQNITQMNL